MSENGNIEDWMEDLDEDAVGRSAEFDIKPRVALPNVRCVLCDFRPGVGVQQQLEKQMLEHEKEHPKETPESIWVGEEKEVVITSKPRKISAEKLPTGEAFVMGVDDGAGIEKDMIAPKTIRFELAKLVKQGINPFGATVVIGAKPLFNYTTKDGKKIKRGKTYYVQPVIRGRETSGSRERKEEPEELEL